ncbi:hypothetical protein AB0G02_40015 [Actinosynnema sp. NPDC023658]|uniref:allene oxide cyclase barrel-like domain-containing protein n=1 Tax=Actinosynnema sp. NPDC023658 TaxID=3155465 RepID=UPI0033DFF24F
MTTVIEFTERTVDWKLVGSPVQEAMSRPGDAFTYYDEVYGDGGEVIGHVLGFVTVAEVRAPDGHVITDYEEAVELPDGTIRVSGRADRADMLAGGTVRFDAVGTSGAYTGLKGTREWYIEGPAGPDVVAHVKITLD